MPRRNVKRNSFSEEKLHENEKEVKGQRKRQQVKYYETSSSEDDLEKKSSLNEKSGNRSRSSDSDYSDFENEDSGHDYENEDSGHDYKKIYRKKDKSFPKKNETKSLSEYEKLLLEKKTKNLEFLKSIGMDEAKNDFLELKPKKRIYPKKDYSESSNAPKRVSERKKAYINYSESHLNEDDNIQSSQGSTEQTFKRVLKCIGDYKYFVEDFSDLLERDYTTPAKLTPVLYDRNVLKELSLIADLSSNKISRPVVSWYPSSEHLVLAIGESNGSLTLWNIEESDFAHKFFIHTRKISNLQFNPSNAFHLISSSSDGTLICCDMQKQMFSEVLRVPNGCTYFDFFSPSSYLVSLSNGQVLIVDRRNRSGEYRHVRYNCHDSGINSIHVHPVAENYFVTAGRDKKICIWDLRKLSHLPVIEHGNNSNSVASAFFSPLSGKYLLTASHDRKICIFDSANLTEKRMQLHKSFKYQICKTDSMPMPTWLPNSDDNFALFDSESSKMLQIYDKDFNLYETVTDGINKIRLLNIFHPFKPAIATLNTAGGIQISAGNFNI